MLRKQGKTWSVIKTKPKAYANEIVPQARGEAARMIQDALAYKEMVIANAEGDADRFLKLLKEYKRAPDVTRPAFIHGFN